MIGDHDAVVVIFSQPQVRHCKTAHFLKTFGPASLPHGPELAAMMGKFQFLVEGWDVTRRNSTTLHPDSGSLLLCHGARTGVVRNLD